MPLGLNPGFVTDSRCKTSGHLLNLSISYLICERKMILQLLLESLQNDSCWYLLGQLIYLCSWTISRGLKNMKFEDIDALLTFSPWHLVFFWLRLSLLLLVYNLWALNLTWQLYIIFVYLLYLIVLYYSVSYYRVWLHSIYEKIVIQILFRVWLNQFIIAALNNWEYQLFNDDKETLSQCCVTWLNSS